MRFNILLYYSLLRLLPILAFFCSPLRLPESELNLHDCLEAASKIPSSIWDVDYGMGDQGAVNIYSVFANNHYNSQYRLPQAFTSGRCRIVFVLTPNVAATHSLWTTLRHAAFGLIQECVGGNTRTNCEGWDLVGAIEVFIFSLGVPVGNSTEPVIDPWNPLPSLPPIRVTGATTTP